MQALPLEDAAAQESAPGPQMRLAASSVCPSRAAGVVSFYVTWAVLGW